MYTVVVDSYPHTIIAAHVIVYIERLVVVS